MHLIKTTLAASLFATLSTGFALAAVTPAEVLAPALAGCPLEDTAGCAHSVRDFIASRPADVDLNDELVDLVAALRYQAQNPSITIDMCLELAAGMRTAASAVTLPAPQAQIESLAATLCDDVPNSSLASVDNSDEGSPAGDEGSEGGESGDETPPEEEDPPIEID